MKIKNLEKVMGETRTHLKEYLELQGRKFSGDLVSCPNGAGHSNDDAIPSCGFFPDDEHFHCNKGDCNAAGDIFSAAHYLEGKPLEGSGFIKENVLYLADLFQISYKVAEYTEREKHRDKILSLLSLTNDAMKRSLKKLNKNHSIRKYIKARRWSGLEDTFDFGYCSYSKLIKFLKKKGYDEQDLIEAGILDRELFNQKLVFALRDPYGRVVGFASRNIAGGKGRYKNSASTHIFRKSEFLYNLDKIRKQRMDSVYVVEGYADVFGLYRHGIKNAVAICGLSMNDAHYRLLVKNKIKKITITLDNDDGGKQAVEKIVSGTIRDQKDLEVRIKDIKKKKDPDAYVKEYGADKFYNLRERTVFEWRLRHYKKDPTEAKKVMVCRAISIEGSPVERERQCSIFAKALNVSTEAVTEEVENSIEVGQGISLSEILKEDLALERGITDFEQWAWSRDKLLGLNAGWPILTQKLDGIQNGFYIIAGAENIGKTSFLLTLSSNLITFNKDKVFVLFFSIDDSIRKIIPKLVAAKCGMAINVISNPKYRIQKGLNTKVSKRLLEERDRSINALKELSPSFAIKDETDIRMIEDMEKFIEIYKIIAGSKQLVVIVDSFHRTKSKRLKFDTRAGYMDISDNIKGWSNRYNVPVICTAELTFLKNPNRRPTSEDLKEISDLKYDTDAIMLLYNEMHHKEGRAKIHFKDDNIMKPIIEAKFAKNKTSGFKGTLFYKFFSDKALVEECSEEEMRIYKSRMEE